MTLSHLTQELLQKAQLYISTVLERGDVEGVRHGAFGGGEG